MPTNISASTIIICVPPLLFMMFLCRTVDFLTQKHDVLLNVLMCFTAFVTWCGEYTAALSLSLLVSLRVLPSSPTQPERARARPSTQAQIFRFPFDASQTIHVSVTVIRLSHGLVCRAHASFRSKYYSHFSFIISIQHKRQNTRHIMVFILSESVSRRTIYAICGARLRSQF